MDFFIADALAQTGGEGGGFISLIPLILIFVLFYFLLIRPQQKKTKKHKQMVEALEVGDEVVTSGGTLGRIKSVDVNFVGMEVAAGVVVQVQRMAIAQLVPSGTMTLEPEPKKRTRKKKKPQTSEQTDLDTTSE